jgi:uncharacterized delta-60 repeat protein
MRNNLLLTVAGLSALSLVFVLNSAQAQTAGSPDLSFGTAGTVSTSFGDPDVFPTGAFEQSNGDIVVVSTVDEGSTLATDIGLARYTSAGVLDTTFGTEGTTVTSVSGLNVAVADFAVQPNGDILVLGTGTVDIDGGTVVLARYKANGKLDTTFGTKGIVTTQTGGTDDVATALLLQANGQFVVGAFQGASSNKGTGAGTQLVRYNSNGTLDTTFGTGGISVVQSPKLAGPAALALQKNGDYLALGSNVVEFSSTGALLTGVTTSALAAINLPFSNCCNPAIFMPNGEFLLTSTVSPTLETDSAHPLNGPSKVDVEVTRFTAKGKADSTFTPTPVSFTPTPEDDEPQTLALQANGQILVGGIDNTAGAFARLNTDGTLDTTFGIGGVVATASLASLLVQTDGNIVAVGSNGGDLVLARFLGN